MAARPVEAAAEIEEKSRWFPCTRKAEKQWGMVLIATFQKLPGIPCFSSDNSVFRKEFDVSVSLDWKPRKEHTHKCQVLDPYTRSQLENWWISKCQLNLWLFCCPKLLIFPGLTGFYEMQIHLFFSIIFIFISHREGVVGKSSSICWFTLQMQQLRLG